ncbi:serine carboxypeptidase-like protein 13 isoform X1 [Tanacetum coccineum]|uniref:Serine carboxypeptidase-like protein 13 isoform X1 n=1 Tax=Tanacetum coccineum TaxID=301880 RepID=A0ABQ5CME6_9ASTR
MLWITGGPGCSSISGILFEIGPIQFKAAPYNGSLPSLIPRPHSWTETASIIFLDFPVGTGFSYAKTTHGSHTTDLQSSDQAYEFMIKWLGNHPQFIPNEFYVGGDSYSGIPVPIITQLISDGNGAGIEPCINLKGARMQWELKLHCQIYNRIISLVKSMLPQDAVLPDDFYNRIFRDICLTVIDSKHIETLEKNIVETLCKLEKIFPPSFFDSMEHLPIHLAYEARVGGPEQYR